MPHDGECLINSVLYLLFGQDTMDAQGPTSSTALRLLLRIFLIGALSELGPTEQGLLLDVHSGDTAAAFLRRGLAHNTYMDAAAVTVLLNNCLHARKVHIEVADLLLQQAPPR